MYVWVGVGGGGLSNCDLLGKLFFIFNYSEYKEYINNKENDTNNLTLVIKHHIRNSQQSFIKLT